MFYGWRVVAGVFIAQLFVVGFFTYAASLLVAPVRAEFGVSLAQVMYSFMVGTLFGLVLMPLAGIMLDRYPVRWLMAFGALAFALGLWVLSLSSTITRFVIAFGVTMSVANGFASSMSASTVIARWFTASRGRALGISAIGTSVGGVLLPKLFGMGIAAFGWREALQGLSLASLVIMLPAVLLLVRGKPSEVQREPEPDANAAPAALAQEQLTTAHVLRMPAFWFMGVSLGLLFSSYSAILANLGPYSISAGHGEGAAATMIMTVAVTGFIGKLIFGALADKVSLKMALAAAQLMVLAGFFMLSMQPGYVLALCATSCIGLAAGGMLPVWGALTARVFGLLSYGRVMGMMGPVITLCVLPGFTVVGRLYDVTGSYTTALQVFCGVLVLAMLLLLPLKVEAAQS
ncbi:MAG: MFS transporter [Gammaproteobacteria bacterium]|nr:MFS transporter [Gammaproteobacteria bacterium]